MKSIRTFTSLILAVIMTVSLFTVTVGAVGVENTQNTIKYTNTNTENNAPEPTTALEIPTEPSTSENVETVPTTETEPTTAPETEPTTEPVSQTVIGLQYTSVNLYVGEKSYVPDEITNGIGKTTYTSTNPDVVYVNQEGKLKAKHRGTANIIIANNDAENSQFKVTVKNPYFRKNGKKIKGITVVKNHTKTIKVVGKVDDIKNTYYNTSKVMVQSGRNATYLKILGLKRTNGTKIYIKVNGVKFALKVKVRNLTTYEKYAKVKVTQKHSTVSRESKGEPIKLSSLVRVKTNFESLINRRKISKRQYKAFEKKVAPVVTIDDGKLLRLSKKGDSLIVRSKVGKTNVFLNVLGVEYRVWVKVKKAPEQPAAIADKKYTTYKGKKAIVVNSYEEYYEVMKSAFYDYQIKGEDTPYYYLVTTFDLNKDPMYMYNRAFSKEELDTGDNLYFFRYVMKGWESTRFIFIEDEKNNVVNFRDYKDSEDAQEYADQMAYNKAVYNEARRIFDRLHIDSFETDYEKLVAISMFLSIECDYWNDEPAEYTKGEAAIIISHQGACTHYTDAFIYLCSMAKIPATSVGCLLRGGGHEMAVVKIQGKWYYYEPQAYIWSAWYGAKDLPSKYTGMYIDSTELAEFIKITDYKYDISDEEIESIRDRTEIDLIKEW